MFTDFRQIVYYLHTHCTQTAHKTAQENRGNSIPIRGKEARDAMAKRRENGEGSVYETPKGSGQWFAQIILSNGRPKRTRAKSRVEAKEKLKDLMAARDGGRFDYDDNPTLQDFVTDWLRVNWDAGNWQYKTYRAYAWVLNTHVLPILGRKKLSAITAHDVGSMVSLLKRKLAAPKTSNPKKLTAAPKKLSVVTQEHAHRVLHKVFEDAVHGFEDRKPCCVVTPVHKGNAPKGKQKADPVSLSAPEVALLRDRGLPESPVRLLVLFMLTTGTRSAEARGVRWCDVDLSKGEVRISGQLQRVKDVDAGSEIKTQLIRKDSTKTHEVRTLVIPAVLAAELAALKLVDGIHDDSEAFVFLNPYGGPVDEKYLHVKLKEACKAAGVKAVSPHKLRHTAATLLVADGRGLHDVQKLLGHKQIALTSDLYAHASKEAMKRSADALGSLVLGTEE